MHLSFIHYLLLSLLTNVVHSFCSLGSMIRAYLYLYIELFEYNTTTPPLYSWHSQLKSLSVSIASLSCFKF